MAPTRPSSDSNINNPPSSNPSPEHSEFIAKLAAYHEKRGTNFDPEPRAGAKTIDLLQLFKAVVDRGGYDKVSDEKKAWRNLGQDFNLGTPALGFALKTVYYKYLAAYEISTIHGKEPPPRDILEDLTAKGGALLSRTIENFRPSTRRETGAGNDNSEASGDDGTPARDRNASEEAPGSGGRVTRGLRQAPPQRVLFQPEAQSSRLSRNTSATSHPPQSHQMHHQHQHQQQPLRGASTSHNPSNNAENHSNAVANYEPRPQMPLTLRPIITPGNNPVEFKRRQQLLKQAQDQANGRSMTNPNRGVLYPGSTLPPANVLAFANQTAAFDGPNIYVRCLCALRSGIPSEQRYALFHLVKISMERGDKYKFESFPGLAESLIEKGLEATSLFYKVDWEILYMDDGTTPGANILDGVNGSQDILQRLASLERIPVDDNVLSAEFSDAIGQVNEAALTIRNMVMLEENAYYISELSPLQDFLSVALNLPSLDCVIELKHYALEIAEQVTKYLHLGRTDPLYKSLLAQLKLQDRGAILTALRAISRISMNLEENNDLRGVSKEVLQNIMDWILLGDEELAHACLDFLYQYTAVAENVEFLTAHLNIEPLVNQLTRLLAHGVKIFDKEYAIEADGRKPAPQDIASLPHELLLNLLRLDEPERSSRWLRCLFEEDQHESITQIALWQAYQNQFNAAVAHASGVQLLVAAEFIKNVSTTFAEKATAQVQPGPQPRFIIRGIRRREVPVDFEGHEFRACKWVHLGSTMPCNKYFMTPQNMYQHILKDHLGARQSEEGKFDNTQPHGQLTCQWEKCSRFRISPAAKLSDLANHIKVHLPPVHSSDAADSSGPPPAKRSKPSYIMPGAKKAWKHHYTQTDERHEASGIPLTSALVLRNLARNIPKSAADDMYMKTKGVSLVDQIFKPVEPRFYEVMAHNKALALHVSDLLQAIKDAAVTAS